MAKKRALADVVKDPLVKKDKPVPPLRDPADRTKSKNGLGLVLAALVGLVGGILLNRFLRII